MSGDGVLVMGCKSGRNLDYLPLILNGMLRCGDPAGNMARFDRLEKRRVRFHCGKAEGLGGGNLMRKRLRISAGKP
jgi:hypothetical protein